MLSKRDLALSKQEVLRQMEYERAEFFKKLQATHISRIDEMDREFAERAKALLRNCPYEIHIPWSQFNPERQDTINIHNAYLVEMETWLKIHCKAAVFLDFFQDETLGAGLEPMSILAPQRKPSEVIVHFEDRDDALLFRLQWCPNET
jgi:hypothetical protein